MVEEDVIGTLVDSNPLDRLSIKVRILRVEGSTQGLEFFAILADVLVAVPACAGRWNVGVSGVLHEAMAVTTIHPQLVNVQLVIVRDGLGWLITNPLCFRSGVIGETNYHPCTGNP